MRKPRLLTAALVVGLTAAGITLTAAPSSGAAEDIPPACPSDTVAATELDGDDFNSGTPRAMAWSFPDGSPFQVRPWQDGGTAGRLNGENRGDQATHYAESTDPITLPAGKTSVITIAHALDLDDGNHGELELYYDDQWHSVDEYAPQTSNRGDHVDVSHAAGKTVRLRLKMGAFAGTVTPGRTGWDIFELSVVRCDQATLPGAPQSLTAVAGLGRATLKWQPPAPNGSGTDDVTGYRVEVDDGQVFEFAPGVTSTTITGLANATTYNVQVFARSAKGLGPAATKRLTGTKTSLTPSSTTIKFGQPVKLTGKVVRIDTGAGGAGWTVKLQRREIGFEYWSTIKTITTTTGGAFSYSTNPSRHYDYRAVYVAGGAYLLGSTSSVRRVNVSPKVTAAWQDSTVTTSQRARISGSVSPNHANSTIYLLIRVNGEWYIEREGQLSSSSTYAFSGYFQRRGTYYYRTAIDSHSDHSVGYSPIRAITVR